MDPMHDFQAAPFKYLWKTRRPLYSVILSEVAASRSEAATQSKACPELAQGDPSSADAVKGSARRFFREPPFAASPASTRYNSPCPSPFVTSSPPTSTCCGASISSAFL